MTDASDDPKLVEAIARAIYEGRNGWGCLAWSRRGHSYQAPYLADARAAIAAYEKHGPARFERCDDCGGSGLALNMSGEPDECRACRGNTVTRVTGSGQKLADATP